MKVKRIIMLIWATIIIGICSYELHIIPRTGIELSKSIFMVFEIIESISIIALLIMLVTDYKEKRSPVNKYGKITRFIYLVFSYFIIQISLFTNSSEGMRGNIKAIESTFIPLTIVAISITIAVFVGMRAITFLFYDKNLMTNAVK